MQKSNIKNQNDNAKSKMGNPKYETNSFGEAGYGST